MEHVPLPEEETMSLETILVWLAVGLISGWLASAVVGRSIGLLGDMVVGIIGAFFGGWLFHALGVRIPFHGLAGTIFTAFIGAIVLLLLLRAVRGATVRRV
jgi:uncharacterized membrane protein YeaQ/YmgE (transglycosylase-associated protein family)